MKTNSTLKSVSKIINLVLDKYILNASSEVKKGNINDFTEVPYYLMALTNLTISEEGQKKYLNVEEEAVKGIRFLQMMDKYLGNVYLTEFDFFSNIIANVSALKEGRVLLLDLKIFKVLLGNLDKLNNMKLLNSLRMIRNCCFEWEKHDDDILSYEGRIFDFLVKILYLSNLDNFKDIKLKTELQVKLDEICFANVSLEQASNEREIINDLVTDIFLILTNSEKCVQMMKTKNTKQIISHLETFIQSDQAIKDRLFVIFNYLEN